MGRVFQRGTRWWVDWSEGGQRIRKPVGLSKLQAQELLRKVELDVSATRHGVASGRLEGPQKTVSEALDAWHAHRTDRRANYTDKQRLTKHVRPVLGGKFLSDVTPADVDMLLRRLRGNGLSPSSVRYFRALLSKLYADAIRWGWVVDNPIRRSEPVRVKQETDLVILTESQVRALIEKSPPSEAVLYGCAVYTTMRKGELYALRWADIDFHRNMVSVVRSDKGPTKSGKPRHIPLHPELRSLLEGWRPVCPSGPLGLVFPRSTGVMRVDKHNKLFHVHLGAAGCPTIGFHSLRHTGITLLLDAGVPPHSVKAIAGHSSIAVTERYIHLIPGRLGDEIRKLRIRDAVEGPVGPEDDPRWPGPGSGGKPANRSPGAALAYGGEMTASAPSSRSIATNFGTNLAQSNSSPLDLKPKVPDSSVAYPHRALSSAGSERQTTNLEVAGSIPAGRTSLRSLDNPRATAGKPPFQTLGQLSADGLSDCSPRSELTLATRR